MRAIVLLLSLLSLAACQKGGSSTGNSTSAVITVTDTQGNTVELQKPAERIVCLFDPSLDVIYMLQAQDKLIGIPVEVYFDNELYDYYKHMDSRVLNKQIATPGSNELANLESVLQLNPDLVIAKHLPESVAKSLQNMGVGVYLASSEKYTDLTKEMVDIAALTGKNERGQQLVAYAENKINNLYQRAKESNAGGKCKSVYFTWANGRIFTTAGRNSMMDDCLNLAGVENVCPTQEIDKPNVNPEILIAWNPDMIVMWNDSPDLFYSKKELATINAIKHEQIYNLMPMFYYNPHTLKSLCAAVAIHNWAYQTSKPEAKAEVEEVLLTLYGNETGEKLLKYL